MGMFDKLKGAAGDHGDKVGGRLDKAGEMVDEKTGGKHSEHIDKGVDLAKDQLGIESDAQAGGGAGAGGGAAAQEPGDPGQAAGAQQAQPGQPQPGQAPDAQQAQPGQPQPGQAPGAQQAQPGQPGPGPGAPGNA